ncbi:enoyl-CoA hydratase/isomerase family protein [Minwuia sp.]|uniref:enoyl-CoA hydratase/isomerase family protein n=1 Tax=Minwuia sp. TaxID=2493630 RepID=UPI003A908CFB
MTDLPNPRMLLLDRRGPNLYVTLNNPERRNALSGEMVEELIEVLDAIAPDRSVRTLIMRGAGGFFCAGGDIKGFKAGFQADADPRAIAASNRTFGDFLIRLNTLPQTVIMLVEGAAMGGGLGLVCVSDVAICDQHTRFSMTETSLGIPPAQIAPFVAERLGITQSRRLMLTGARFKGEEALKLGLVHYCEGNAVGMETRLEEVLDQIDRSAPAANAATKDIVLTSRHTDLSDTLDMAARHFADCMLSDEGREGVSAFLEKRNARWIVRGK